MDATLHVMDLGRRAYQPVHALQEALVAARVAGTIPDTLVLVEHDPVYTLGRRAEDAHILFAEDQRKRLGIDLVRTARGGDVTYHGPGQLVGYPIFDLRVRDQGAVWYVGQLEGLLIRVLAGFGVEARRDCINRGVWVGTEKIAAIGVRITRHVTMHGFALNVNPDLTHYAGIVPCGIQGRGVTTLNRWRPDLDLAAVKGAVVDAFVNDFGFARAIPSAPSSVLPSWESNA